MSVAGDARLEAGRHVFSDILVGVDGSEPSLEAARQAAVLRDPDGRLTLVSVWDIASTVAGGTGTRVPYYYDEALQRTAAEHALESARLHLAGFPAPETKLVHGAATAALLAEMRSGGTTLAAVGSSGTGRLRGALLGSVTAELVHAAPCSVLIARDGGWRRPARVAVGVDGSLESAAAYAAGLYLAQRFDAELRAIVCWGGRGASPELVARITDGGHVDRREAPADALVAASSEADLLIVGSRGLHGPRALGSVSERVANGASCSVLVVR